MRACLQAHATIAALLRPSASLDHAGGARSARPHSGPPTAVASSPHLAARASVLQKQQLFGPEPRSSNASLSLRAHSDRGHLRHGRTHMLGQPAGPSHRVREDARGDAGPAAQLALARVCGLVAWRAHGLQVGYELCRQGHASLQIRRTGWRAVFCKAVGCSKS